MERRIWAKPPFTRIDGNALDDHAIQTIIIESLATGPSSELIRPWRASDLKPPYSFNLSARCDWLQSLMTI